jgi:threonine/homoserine/homoserine lactone efflux protein
MMTGALTVALLGFVTVGLISAEAWLWAVVTGFFGLVRLVLLGIQGWRAWADARSNRPQPTSPSASLDPGEPGIRK